MFDEADLENPEELIASLKKEDEIKEKGEFVVVNTEKPNNNKSSESIYKKDFADEHYVMLILDQPNYRTAFITRGFMMFNNLNYRALNLRTSTDNLVENTLLNISTFENARLADDYLKKANGNKNIFATLTDVKYHFVSISKTNYDLLKQSNDAAGYLKFYEFTYDNIPEIIEKPKVAEEPKPAIQKPKQDVILPTSTTPVEKTETEIKAETTPVAEPEPEPEPAVQVYSTEKEVPHNVIYVIPAQGVNTALLTMYINRFKSISFNNLSIEVGTKDFNSVKKLITISGFANADMASQFDKGIANDQRVTLSLRAVTYDRLVISNSNLEKMIELNDLKGYKTFVENNY